MFIFCTIFLFAHGSSVRDLHDKVPLHWKDVALQGDACQGLPPFNTAVREFNLLSKVAGAERSSLRKLQINADFVMPVSVYS